MLPTAVLIWPTPNVCGNYNRKGCSDTSGDGLKTAVTAWPTPSVADAMGGHATRSGARSNEPLLNGAVRLWPTPGAGDAKQAANPEHHAERLAQKAAEGIRLQVHPTAAVKGQLNPAWCEPLMGWEMGWTDITQPCTGAWPGFPMGQGLDQHPWEPSRTIPKGSVIGRNVRIKALGNGVVPQCAEAAYLSILAPASAFLAMA